MNIIVHWEFNARQFAREQDDALLRKKSSACSHNTLYSIYSIPIDTDNAQT